MSRAPMIVAVLALVFAASGSAIAAGHLTGGDTLIKKHSLSGNRLRNHTITGKQVDLSQLGTVPSAANADHATSADTATSASSAPISRLDYESTTVALSPDGPGSGTASCPTGLNVIGGGAQVSNESDSYVNDSSPVGRTAWQATGVAFTGPDSMTIYVICGSAAQTTP